jgi:predicted acyltransferase
MAHSGRRLLSLDAFRGLTIAAMLLVNNPGRWGDAFIYPPLRHAAWSGCTPTDFIFPFFLFIVGVAMVFSFTHRVDEGQSRRLLFDHVWRRSLVLILLGLFQSRFPCFPPYPGGIGEAITAAGPGGLILRLGGLLVYVVVLAFLLGIRRTRPWSVALAVGLATTLLGQWLAPALDSSWFWHHLVEARVPGVLFRIGICYFLAAGLYLGRGSPRVLLAVPTGILVATAVWMLYVPIPGFGRPALTWTRDCSVYAACTRCGRPGQARWSGPSTRRGWPAALPPWPQCCWASSAASGCSDRYHCFPESSCSA